MMGADGKMYVVILDKYVKHKYGKNTKLIFIEKIKIKFIQ